MASIVLALISGLVNLVGLYIKRRFDLKEIEAGRKKVKGGKLVNTTEEEQNQSN